MKLKSLQRAALKASTSAESIKVKKKPARAMKSDKAAFKGKDVAVAKIVPLTKSKRKNTNAQLENQNSKERISKSISVFSSGQLKVVPSKLKLKQDSKVSASSNQQQTLLDAKQKTKRQPTKSVEIQSRKDKARDRSEESSTKGNATLTKVDLMKHGAVETRRSKDWEGNSNATDSVDSAILEEDICFKCGKSTYGNGDWSDIILCDICDGEFHVACTGLERVPRSGYRCEKCNLEATFFLDLKYNLQGKFKVYHNDFI
jgi:hypothetical protein